MTDDALVLHQKDEQGVVTLMCAAKASNSAACQIMGLTNI
jgi:hypothetical protein